MDEIKAYIRDVPDFPKEGIMFKDITPLLHNPDAFNRVIDHMVEMYAGKGVDVVVGMESRGFIFGVPIALRLNVPFVPIRKAGKLPYEKVSISYSLEYGEATIEVHKDAIKPGEKVLVVDDLLATGGTAAATCELIERLGGEVLNCAFVIELAFLNGREKLPEGKCVSLISF